MLIKCFYKIFKLWPHPQNSGHSEASLTNTKNYKIFSEVLHFRFQSNTFGAGFLYNSEGEWGSIGLLRNHWFLMEEGGGVGDGIG